MKDAEMHLGFAQNDTGITDFTKAFDVSLVGN